MDISLEQFDSPNFNPNKCKFEFCFPFIETFIQKRIIIKCFHFKDVKEISHGCVGGVELQQQRCKIQNIADETSNLLKKNVYRNYTLFIETAKEISRKYILEKYFCLKLESKCKAVIFFLGLEGDMYQLSHLLSEQRSLLTTLATTSMFEDQKRIHLSETESKEDDDDADMKRRQALSDVAEKIEGCIVR